MKKQVLLFLGVMLGVTPSLLYAQAPIPNGDFEQWSNGVPVGWTVDDTTVVGHSFTPVTQTSDAESGSSALMGTVVGLGVNGTNFGQLPPLLAAGTVSSTSAGGFVYTDHPNSITGFYKFNPVAGDSITVIAVFKKNGTGIGGGGGTIKTASSAYSAFAFPIYWNSSDAPDSADITVSIQVSESATSNIGSTMQIDNLAFSNQQVNSAVASSSSNRFSLDQNFPNPILNSSIASITYSLPASGYSSLTLYDMSGRIIAQYDQGFVSAGRHLVQIDCHTLPAGIYSYRLSSNGETASRMMQVLH